MAGIVIGVLAGVGILIYAYSYYQKKYKNEAASNAKAISAFDKLDDEEDDYDTQL